MYHSLQGNLLVMLDHNLVHHKTGTSNDFKGKVVAIEWEGCTRVNICFLDVFPQSQH